ncbi:MAG TPA: ABC transporter substrate-binding protein [Acidimicrobiia bacterium]|nr:ABC transporter substrate-binding protein [Acidimicrobiia bacterium]
MKRHLALIGACALLVAGGCGSSGPSSSSDTTKPTLPACPLDALNSATKPVEITYWHAMARANEDELKKLTAQFNAQQHDVHVTLSASPSYSDNFTRFKAGLSTHVLPDLMQSDDTSTQSIIDSGAVLPMAACVSADHATTADLLPRVVAYYTVQGVLWGMPFNDSNLVLYYNKSAFRRAGLDPNTPPVSFDDVRRASQQIVRSGAAQFGIALKTDSPYIEHWLAKAGHTFVNNGNGRDRRATAVTFDDATGLSLFQWMDDMVTSKLALSTGTSDFNHYFAVGNGQAAMTIDSSAALGTISQLFAAGRYKSVELGVGKMPGPNNPDGSVLVGGAANYVVARSSPAKQAAAYQFAKFLSSPSVQAQWAAATGYVPVSRSAVRLEPLATRYTRNPEYKVAYDQLVEGPVNAATTGPVIGAYGSKTSGVRGAIDDNLSRVLNHEATPAQALHEAAQQADAAIEEYNARIAE